MIFAHYLKNEIETIKTTKDYLRILFEESISRQEIYNSKPN